MKNIKRFTLLGIGLCLMLTATQAQTDSIVRVGACATDYYPCNIALGDSCLNVVDMGDFVVIDKTNPLDPQILSTLHIMGVQEICVRDTVAYLSTGSMFVVTSIAQPDSPRIMGATDSIPSPEGGIFVRDTIAFVAGETDGVIVCDVTDPTDPTWIGGFPTCCAMNLTMQDSLLFVADRDSLLIVNAKDPVNMWRMGALVIPEKAYDVAVQDDYAYVAGKTDWSGTDSRLKIVDISDPRNPNVVGEVTGIRGDPVAVYLENGYAYVAATDWWAKEKKGKADVEGGIRVSVAHPDSESLVVSYNTPGNPQDVCVEGEYIYVADYDSVQILKHTRVGVAEEASTVKTGEVSLRIWPTLFDERVNIAFTIGMPTDGRIEIYDKVGRKIRTLYDGSLFPASYRFHWNGRDEKDAKIRNGEYFISVSIGNDLRETRKVTYFRQGGVR